MFNDLQISVEWSHLSANNLVKFYQVWNMTLLLSIDRVKYECSCGEWESLNRLYFCRHCSNIRCMVCVNQEMDTSFCPSCLDNVSTGEARQKRNRCSNCYQCPVCGWFFIIELGNYVICQFPQTLATNQ